MINTFSSISNNPSDLDWVAKIDPRNAVFRGRAYLAAKRVMDLGLTLLALPLLAPLMGVIALLVRLDSPGAPVIFAQKRTGKGGRDFKMYKFRTMAPDAEAMKPNLLHLNELQWPDFKITDDPRITRLGRILRRTSLDELPQVFNIIKNQMSLVGPRPTSFSAETYKLWQTERLDVLPGLTGLWQIAGRAATEFDDRLRLDIIYIEHRCLWLDIQILLRTVVAVLLQRGAH